MAATEVSTIKDFLPLVSVTVGGLIAIVGGFLGTWWVEFIRERNVRRSVALAFKGEVESLLDIIDKRGYISGFQKAKLETESTGHTQIYGFRARRKYFSVFEANASRVGILKPPLPGLVARFYTQANAILEDMERFEGVEAEGIKSQDAVDAYAELLALFDDLVSTGQEIVNEVSRAYN